MNNDSKDSENIGKSLEKKNTKEKAALNWPIIICVTVTVLLLITALGVFAYSKYQAQQVINAKTEASASTDVVDMTDVERYEDYTTINYDGTTYVYNTDIKTVLFLGVDQLDGTEEEAGESGRSDTMILLLVNTAEETVTMLSISRDTIAEVDIANDYGESIMSADMHLALQYSYGDGGTTSCALSRTAVSRLLYGIPIDYYMSMNLDGLNGIITAIGGLTITLEEDYTYIDESLVLGETVTMDGALAESFVRYRDTSELGSNDDRMRRQEVFLDAFISQMKTKVDGNTSSLETMWNLMSNYLITDLNIDTIEKLATYEMNEESYTVPGETVEGEYHDEYIVDEEELKKTLVELLYKVK